MTQITLLKRERSFIVIQALLDATYIDAEGRAGHNISFETDARYEILTRNIKVAGLENIDTLRNLVLRSIGELKQIPDPIPENFILIFTHLAQAALDLPSNTYKILFVLNAREIEISRILPLGILEVRLELSNWDVIQKSFEYKEWVSQFDWREIFREEALLSPDFVPLIAITNERNWSDAFDKANQAINLFRAVLNLGTDYGRRTMMGEPPLANFLPSPIYGVFKDGKFDEGYYTRQKYKYKAASLSDGNIRGLSSMFADLREPISPDDTMSLFLDALQKYGQAMDAIDWREAFLPFWQILEAITLQTDNIRMDEVIARLKTIFKNDALYGDLLDSMRKIRNKLVHEGQFSESGIIEVNLLKIIVEQVIMFLSSAIKELPTRKHLVWFYTFASLNDKDLNKSYDETIDQEFKTFLEKLRDSRLRNRKGKKSR